VLKPNYHIINVGFGFRVAKVGSRFRVGTTAGYRLLALAATGCRLLASKRELLMGAGLGFRGPSRSRDFACFAKIRVKNFGVPAGTGFVRGFGFEVFGFKVPRSGFSTLKDAGFYDRYVSLRAAKILQIIKISVGNKAGSRFWGAHPLTPHTLTPHPLTPHPSPTHPLTPELRQGQRRNGRPQEGILSRWPGARNRIRAVSFSRILGSQS